MTHKYEAAPVKAQKGLSTKHILLILGSLIIVCGAVVAVIVLLRPAASVTAGIPVIDESNLDDITREMEEKVAKGMFETHMNTTWTFPDGQSPSRDAVMGNAASNHYPFWFEVTVPGAEGVVYTSSLLPVGSQIVEIILDKDLDPGNYPAVVTIHMVEEDGTEVESNMGFNITLMVEN
jgi:hypothetical protein